ncbi:MAG: bile acid:sodium symporter family protein [Bacteroidia bacterium]|nr:bile acid:sodium symporter family protein [Bacteroidia bacterium]
MKKLSTTFFLAAALCLLIALVAGFMAGLPASGPFIILMFLCLAIGMNREERLKGYSFTMVIFTAVSAAMFYPAPFISAGDFQFKTLIVPILMVIMFGMGTSMSFKDFMGVIQMPKGVVVGLLCQFTIMPFLGYALAMISGFPPEIAAGIILIGCAPSGLASNVMNYIAGGNLPLSVTITMLATLVAPVMTPFLMKILADQLVEVSFWAMLIDIMKIVFIPTIAGLVFNHFFHGKFKWLDKSLPIASMAGIGAVITIITALGRESLLSIGLTLILLVIVHNTFGYFLGYWGGRLAKMDEQSCRTIAIEVGMQNGGLASGIALEMGKIATMGLAPAVFGPFMNISGSILATWWRGKPVADVDVSKNKQTKIVQ